MCRALQVLCGASNADALMALKRAVVSKEYELTGGATDPTELLREIEERRPDAVVLDVSMAAAAEAVRAEHPSLRLVVVGAESEAADAWVRDPADARAAVLNLPRPGGPVR